MKKRWLFILAIFLPVILFAGDDTQTDIVPRTVNFLIFLAIIYYLLADKLKTFFNDRSKSIQSQLDEVQMKLEESKRKMELAKAELEHSKLIANNLVKDSLSEVASIKAKIEAMYTNDMNILSKNYDAKIELEARKAKKEITNEILDELFSDNNITITKDNLQNNILKKVA